MKIAIGLTLAVIATNFLAPVGALASSSDEAKIRALEAAFASAVQAKDLDAIMKVYVPDESLFVFDMAPPRQYVGAAAFRKAWSDYVTANKAVVKFEIQDLSVAADGTIGYGHSIQHFSGSDAAGKPLNMTVRVSDVYRKINDNWLIVQEHISVPVDMATMKPDLSSKP